MPVTNWRFYRSFKRFNLFSDIISCSLLTISKGIPENMLVSDHKVKFNDIFFAKDLSDKRFLKSELAL